MYSKKIIVIFLVLTLFATLASWPFFQSGFFVTDDGDWMVIRLSAFHETLKSGQFPVRYLERLNHGYGYPVLNFLYPLPFYVGEIIHILGPSFESSVKLIFILSFFLSALSMYRYASAKWGSLSGLFAALIYICLPYRIFDVYVRGSLGESVAFVFIPLILNYIDKFANTNRKIDLVLGALSYSGLILSHNTVAFIVSFGLVAYIVYKSSYKSILIFLLGLVVSAFFWFPAIHDLQYTRAAAVRVSNYQNYFLSLKSLFKYHGPGGILVVLTSFAYILRKRDWALFLLMVGLILALFLTNSVSDIIWAKTSLPKLVQFPWRFLSIVAFLLAATAGYLGSKMNQLVILLVTTLVLIWGLASINPIRTFRPDSFYSTNDGSTTVKNEYMPIWVTNDPINLAKNKLEILDGSAKLGLNNKLEVLTLSTVRINRFFFPGIAVKVNGIFTPFEYLQDGLLKIKLQPGTYTVTTIFAETPVRLFSDILSLTGLMLCSIIIIKHVSS